MKKPNWREWRHIEEVRLWQAVALSMNMDPHSVTRSRYEWMAGEPLFEDANFQDDDESEEFHLRLRLLIANKKAPAFTPSTLSMESPLFHGVLLREFASWASEVMQWPNLPPELTSLAKDATASTPVKSASSSPHNEVSLPSSPDSVEQQLGWFDGTLGAKFWWKRKDVQPKDAAMLLCCFDPHKETSPELITTDETSPEDYVRLLCAFEDVARTNQSHRTLRQWLEIARNESLKYHSWINLWAAHYQQLPTPADSTPPTAKPMARHAAQDSAILATIEQLGYDAKSLPRGKAGKAGVKSEVKKECLKQNSVFVSSKVFDKAWERLRSNREIINE